jgi:hypothetical protein
MLTDPFSQELSAMLATCEAVLGFTVTVKRAGEAPGVSPFTVQALRERDNLNDNSFTDTDRRIGVNLSDYAIVPGLRDKLALLGDTVLIDGTEYQVNKVVIDDVSRAHMVLKKR